MITRVLSLSGLALFVLIGCTGSTAVSTQPSAAEIQQGIDRRIAEVDKQQGLTPEMKERMKAQIRGNQADPNRK
ncbi:MAG: hypothetical protein H7Y17_00055 [Chlorobia bacterium]|nr:hypothetical protein [Fimbriimonadaceae bacterium]